MRSRAYYPQHHHHFANGALGVVGPVAAHARAPARVQFVQQPFYQPVYYQQQQPTNIIVNVPIGALTRPGQVVPLVGYDQFNPSRRVYVTAIAYAAGAGVSGYERPAPLPPPPAPPQMGWYEETPMEGYEYAGGEYSY